jgi:hypothetical protein
MGWSGRWIRLGADTPDDGFTDVPLTAVGAQAAGNALFLYRVGSDALFGPSQVISMAYADPGSAPDDLVWIHNGVFWNHAGSGLVPPGGATNQPVAVAFGDGVWFMFARGLDQRVYVAACPSNTGNAFGDFQLLVPAPIQTDRSVAVLKHVKFQICYRGVDNKAYSRVFDGAPDDPNANFNETEIPGGLETDAPLALAALPGSLPTPTVFAFARNWDQSILYQTALGGEAWSDGWTEVPGGGKTDCALASTVFQGQLFLFATGTDYGVYVNVLGNGGWSGWEQVPGGARTNVAVSATTFAQPQGGSDIALYLVIRGLDQKPWFTVLT